MKYKDTLITARELRKSSTPSEKILWEALRNKRFNNLKFRRQHVIAGFILDFYCPSIKLGIEVDGAVHRREENRNYDKERDVVIKEHGVTIMRIESKAIELALPAVLRAIAIALKIN
jgi:adenine-specific DNA-methyltransferase